MCECLCVCVCSVRVTFCRYSEGKTNKTNLPSSILFSDEFPITPLAKYN